MDLRSSAANPSGWIILYEPELHLGAEILVPDLAGWRRERMPELRDAAFATLARDWVCEVLSPSTHRLDRGNEARVYTRERVSQVWFADPLEKYLEVLRLDGDTYRMMATFTEPVAVHAEPFAAIVLDLAAVWAR